MQIEKHVDLKRIQFLKFDNPLVQKVNIIGGSGKIRAGVLTTIFSHQRISQRAILLDFPLTVKVATLIFISGRGSAISSAKEGKSGFIYNLVKS